MLISLPLDHSEGALDFLFGYFGVSPIESDFPALLIKVLVFIRFDVLIVVLYHKVQIHGIEINPPRLLVYDVHVALVI